MISRLTIDEINALATAEALGRFGNLFEFSSWIVAETWRGRPFASVGTLHGALVATVAAAGRERQLALIRAHPDLVGRAALGGTLTHDSTSEQRAAGLDPGALTTAEIDAFAAANAHYRERFGFPFVICARENRKGSIVDGLHTRLANDVETEIATALREIGRIAWYRLIDIAAADGPPPDDHA